MADSNLTRSVLAYLRSLPDPYGLRLIPRHAGPPSLADLCKIGGIDFPTPRCTNFDKHMREEIKYMYMHEYADGLNKLLETQWYTNNGLDRLFANFQLQQQFAGTLELFAKTKTTNFDEFLRLPPCERKLVTELMLLPMKVPNPNPGDTELQTVSGDQSRGKASAGVATKGVIQL